MLSVVRKRIGRALPLLIATLVVGVGGYFVCMSAINDLQSSQAGYVAESFGKYLVEEVPQLDDIMDGKVTSGVPADTLATIKPIGEIFKFRLYDPAGNLKVDSSPFAAGHVVSPRNAFEDATAERVAETGNQDFALRQGDGRVLPRYYSEVMVPLLDSGRAIGVLSVLSDETQAWPELLEQLRSVIVKVLALVVIAFGVPVALYLRKLAQLESTRRRLRHSAQHDDLTGILNRAGFSKMLGEQLQGAHRPASIGVHIIDLDRFKDINDANGHAVGDEVLKQASARIRRLLGTRERLARLGADEFAILQPSPLGTSQVVAGLADEVAQVLSRPFVIEGKSIQIGASVGYAISPGDGTGEEDLMRAADVALRHAKQHNRGRAVSFDRSMEAERQTRRRIDARLRTALANSDFDLHFQPVFETATGKLRGFEALLRLADDEGRAIPPAEFIPVAEEVGLIDDIGQWVLREACRVARQWPDELFVAVNLSPAQFAGGTMARRVRDVLAWSGLRAGRLELEVTESLLITDTDAVLRELEALKALGVSLALDDFGTGYSSLSYLWRFPFDKLKVDRSFMADLTVNGAKSREILATIIALGRVLDLTITAEGVETEAQAAVLRELNCDLVQGYLFGRPQPAIEVAATILKAFGASSSTPASDRTGPAQRAFRRG